MKFICFDLDGTLTKEHSWLKLNVALGMSPERDTELYKQYSCGSISYSQWQEEIIASYQRTQVPHRTLVEKTFQNPDTLPCALQVIQAVKEKGYTIVLISGSFDYYVQQVAKQLHIDAYKACSCIKYDSDGYVESIIHSNDEHVAKLKYLEEFAEQYDISLTECICVGDGPNDLDMFQATGKGITFAGSSVEHEAWKVVDSLEEIPAVI